MTISHKHDYIGDNHIQFLADELRNNEVTDL